MLILNEEDIFLIEMLDGVEGQLVMQSRQYCGIALKGPVLMFEFDIDDEATPLDLTIVFEFIQPVKQFKLYGQRRVTIDDVLDQGFAIGEFEVNESAGLACYG